MSLVLTNIYLEPAQRKALHLAGGGAACGVVTGGGIIPGLL